VVTLAVMLLPVLLWTAAAAARRARGEAAQQGREGPVPAPQQQAPANAPRSAPPMDNYVLRVRESGAGGAGARPPAAPPERARRASEAPPAPAVVPPAVAAPSGADRRAAAALAAALGKLPELQRAWVALELLGPPVGLREDERDPW
jgi:hypothetical protein